MSHEKKRRDSELSLLLRLPPQSGNLSSTGRKGVCGKPGRVSCTMMIPIFQNFLKL